MEASQKVAKVKRHQRKSSDSSSCSSVPDLQKCTPPQKDVFDCILEEYNGTVSFVEISSRQDLFPVGCGDIAAWFKARKASFLLRESKEGQILEVSTFCRQAQLCFKSACSTENCQYVHVCRDYIAGFCRFGARCQRNHSFQYDKDRKFLSKLRLNGLSENNLRKVIQLSIPQVCLDYNEGNCPRGQCCGQIHICKNMVKKKCGDEQYCGLQHKDTLLTPHTAVTLQRYGLNIKDGNVNQVLRILLVCVDKPVSQLNDYRGSTFLVKNILVSTQANGGKASYQGVPAPSKNSSGISSGISSEPSEQKVFECLYKEYDCSVSFSVIAKRTDLFPNKFKDLESWFRRKKSSFRLTENGRGIILQVDAFSAKARLCFSYNVPGMCKKESCSYLHVCRDYITDSCRDGATCMRNHHFHNEKDKALLSRIKLDQLTEKQLCRLIRSSVPLLCVKYNYGICDCGDDCPRIHMCSDHLKKCHREGYDCKLDHECAMTSNHTQTILEHYHMEHLKSEVVKRIVLVYDEAGHVHHNKPDAPICSDFILGKCKKGFKCPGHHCLLPFHWEYKLPDDKWKSFNETDNEKLEKLYCDVTLEEWSATGYHITLESDGFLLLDAVDFLFHYKRLLSKQKDLNVMADIRRLSSESYASNPEDPVATAWTWYWQNENGIWLKYDVDHLGRDMQILIEEAFLSKSKCIGFRISDQDYRLYFSSTTEMHQENVRYGTRKEVRRRPEEFQSRTDIQLKRSQSANQKADNNATSANVPSHWSAVPSVKQYTRVPLTSTSSEYKETETLFKKTVNKNVVISGIERVQNPFMWEKYQRKKENMQAVKTGGQKRSFLNEKRLFHGTSPETVEAICKQNFDWRLHGKNATVYGEGSYFALNASYSDAYAKEDANSCRFMFVAKVLVGSYTKGHSSYRRPPQKDSSDPASDLYDSCVDDKSNPTIFVVFDTDQFYPEYIVKYSHESAQYPSAVAYQTTHGSYQQPVAKKPVPKPRVPKAAPLQPGASQVRATSTAAILRSSSTPGTSVYSSTHGVSVGHSTGLNAAGVSPYSKTSGSNSGSTSGYNTSSASNATSTRHQTAATRPQSGASNSYNFSSASSTTVTGVSSYSKTSGSSSGSSAAGSYTSSPLSTSSTRYQNTTSRSNPSTQSGSKSSNKSSRKYKSSSKDKSKCSVM